MKKMNAILAALTLAVTALTPLASSATDIKFKEGRNQMTVSTTYAASYELEIPADVNDLAVDKELEVKATGFLHVNEEMIVSVESENEWNIVDTTCANNEIKYNVSVDGKIIEDKKADILTVTPDKNNEEQKIIMKVDSIATPNYAGTYTDTLTFSARSIIEETGEEKAPAPATSDTTSTATEATTTAVSSEEEDNKTSVTTTPVETNQDDNAQ